MGEKYDWVTTEMFDEVLEEIVEEQAAGIIITIPGIYEVLSEHFNNDVLERLKDRREEEQGSVCPDRADGGPHEYTPALGRDVSVCTHCGEEE